VTTGSAPGRLLGLAPVWLLFLVTALLLQVANGAFVADLDLPDEAAHFVTGLMIRDYLASGFAESPLAFATTYYVHYPKVAFGIWPPLFHVLEAVWLLVFPVAYGSVFVLLAAIAGALATLACVVARRDVGFWPAVGVGAVVLLMPSTQFVTSHLLADALVALLDLAAALCLIACLRSGRTRDGVSFGVLGSLSMLTKGSGMAILLLPFVTVAMMGAPRLLARKTFWLGPALMVVLAGPWQFVTWSMLRSTVVGSGTSDSIADRAVAYGWMAWQQLGPAGAMLAVVGIGVVVWRRLREGAVPEHQAVLPALAMAVVGFHVLTPLAPNPRYLVSASPAFVWLAAFGGWTLSGVLSGSLTPRVRGVLVALVIGGSVLGGAWRAVQREDRGMARVADVILEEPGSVVLVSGASDERDTSGMVIAEVAARDRSRAHIVLRAGKVLSRSTWDGSKYELLYDTPEEIREFLAGIPVTFVVAEVGQGTGLAARPHHRLLLETMSRFDGEWVTVSRVPNPLHGEDFVVYRAAGAPVSRRAPISIDMRYTLGGVLTLPEPRRDGAGED